MAFLLEVPTGTPINNALDLFQWMQTKNLLGQGNTGTLISILEKIGRKDLSNTVQSWTVLHVVCCGTRL
jgi:hypothetical protein